VIGRHNCVPKAAGIVFSCGGAYILDESLTWSARWLRPSVPSGANGSQAASCAGAASTRRALRCPPIFRPVKNPFWLSGWRAGSAQATVPVADHPGTHWVTLLSQELAAGRRDRSSFLQDGAASPLGSLLFHGCEPHRTMEICRGRFETPMPPVPRQVEEVI